MKFLIRVTLLAVLLALLFLSISYAQEDDGNQETDVAARDAAADDDTAATPETADAARDADDDDADDDDDDYEAGQAAADNVDQKIPFVCHAFFPNATSPVPTFHAGTMATSTIVFQNNGIAPSTIVLAAGILQPKYAYDSILRNFSVVRHGRVLHPKESNTFRYSFLPDVYLEPGEYNLVLSLYFQDGASNQTFAVTAYNSTVLVDEALGTDPRTVLTYLTLLVIFGALAYYVADRTGILKTIKNKRTASKQLPASAAAGKGAKVGKGALGYDPDFIPKEHQMYREKLMKEKEGRNASPKKTV